MDDHEHSPGRRKDGRPFKSGNTRVDGSYDIGRNRPPAATRFAVGDGRARGRRPKGTKNLATDWSEELAERITITEGGKPKRVTKQRALVKSTVARAMKSSDRAAETAFRHAMAERSTSPILPLTDSEIIAAWLAQRSTSVDEDVMADQVSDRDAVEAGDDQ